MISRVEFENWVIEQEIEKWEKEHKKELSIKLSQLEYDFETYKILRNKLLDDLSLQEKTNIEKHLQNAQFTLGFKKFKPNKSIEDYKKIPMKKVLDLLGIEEKKGFILCPSHNEKTPSCKIYENSNHAFCFGCGKNHTTIDVVMAFCGVPLKMALKKLQDLTP